MAGWGQRSPLPRTGKPAGRKRSKQNNQDAIPWAHQGHQGQRSSTSAPTRHLGDRGHRLLDARRRVHRPQLYTITRMKIKPHLPATQAYRIFARHVLTTTRLRREGVYRWFAWQFAHEPIREEEGKGIYWRFAWPFAYEQIRGEDRMATIGLILGHLPMDRSEVCKEGESTESAISLGTYFPGEICVFMPPNVYVFCRAGSVQFSAACKLQKQYPTECMCRYPGRLGDS